MAMRVVARKFSLFDGISEQEKQALLNTGKTRSLKSGESLFLHGDRVNNFYIVCEGAIQLSRETPDGHEMTAEVLIAGDTIGETEILQPKAVRPFTAIAVKDAQLLEFPMSWLKDTAKRYNVFALNLLEALSRRLHIATVEAEHKTTMTAAQQVACFLERLCILHDFDPHGFELPYSKTLIASRLGMELETFSRALSKIRDHGITIKGTHVSFDNLEKMESFVCANCSIVGNCNEHEQLIQRLKGLETHRDK